MMEAKQIGTEIARPIKDRHVGLNRIHHVEDIIGERSVGFRLRFDDAQPPVHHTMHKSHAHPVDDHVRRSATDFREPCCVRFCPWYTKVRKVVPNCVIYQLTQHIQFAARGKDLEVSESRERAQVASHPFC